jgi:hypothetical protein
MRTDPRHYEIRWQIKNHIAHIKQREARRDLFRRDMQHGAEIVALVDVHGLREPDVGADGGTHEVEDPEGGEDAAVEFAISSSVFRCFPFVSVLIRWTYA